MEVGTPGVPERRQRWLESSGFGPWQASPSSSRPAAGGRPPQDLTLSGVSPNSPSVAQGGSVTLTLTFTSQNGFQGTVSLSVTKDGQEPSWLTLSPASKSLNVPKGGQAQETLQLQVAGNAPTGPHALKLRATYGDKTAERDCLGHRGSQRGRHSS